LYQYATTHPPARASEPTAEGDTLVTFGRDTRLYFRLARQADELGLVRQRRCQVPGGYLLLSPNSKEINVIAAGLAGVTLLDGTGSL
jgi:hypothetical protein